MKKSELRALITESVKQAIHELSPNTIRNASMSMQQKGQVNRANNLVTTQLNTFVGKPIDFLGGDSIKKFKVYSDDDRTTKYDLLDMMVDSNPETNISYRTHRDSNGNITEESLVVITRGKSPIDISTVPNVTLQDFNLIRTIINTFTGSKNSKYNKKENFRIKGY